MPGPVALTAYGIAISVDKTKVHLMRIFVDPDGNGAVELPHEGTLTVLNVPGSALSVLATLKAQCLGFTMRVAGGSSVAAFLGLTA
ncbi:MAG: hypothetical protein IPK78_17315 [Rhodospirillales bacterium]|nr:hypothetical protein [Rhodospirillales bacterium]